jgi:NitT/TauT family transport system substrate-binding protein/putative hydroxymethylpyrimidine transport system substrate-binding protein
VVLRRRGVRTREFRVDDFGAPPYPEVVLIATRRTIERRPELVEAVATALRRGTEEVLREPEPAVRDIARAGGADAGLVRAQLRAVAPAMRPPLRLRRAPLEAWARWDARFGILKRRPDVDRAFALER